MELNIEFLKHKLEINKAKLIEEIKVIQCKIDEQYDHAKLNILHNSRKKLNKKLESLNKRLENNTYVKPAKKNKLTAYTVTKWYEKYPHMFFEHYLIVSGKNALKSESLKTHVRSSGWYYHIFNTTGGSVLCFKKEFSADIHHICLQFAAIFSSYWKLSLANICKINYTESKNVMLRKGLNAGTFYLKGDIKSDKISVHLPIYYDTKKGILSYTFTDTPVGHLIKNPQKLLYDQIMSILENKEHKMNKTLIDTWFPTYGEII